MAGPGPWNSATVGQPMTPPVQLSPAQIMQLQRTVLPPGHPLFQEMQAKQMAAGQPLIIDRVEAPSEMTDEIGKMAQEGVEETVSNEVFSAYRYNEVLPGCKPHPGDIVEAGSLAALPPPPVIYPLADSIPSDLIAEGKLSSLQLEGIVYACQRHLTILPNGTRAGFFIGDAAGVGKGRQIAGIVLDNFARGRTKHIWFSISADLIVDARRDLSDIGCYIKVIEGCQQLDKETRVFGLTSDFKEGVVFSTYATLVSAVQKGGAFNSSKHSRLQQLVDWCGGTEFEGCLIFDECHKAKNFVPGKEQSSTKVALSVAAIQRLLPRARVVYCSATGVTDVKNMAFMERLGLWGEGAPFKSFENFLETVQRKGLGVAEMLAMEMKSTGMYVSRGLSYKSTEFYTIEAPLTKEQRKVYDTAAHVWNELRKSLENAIIRTHTTNTRIWASFWAAHQRFFKQLCMGMKVPAIIEESETALEEGKCVVIGLQTTGEASLESEISRSGVQIKGFVSLCREILARFIEQHFPTVIEGSKEGPPEDDWSVTAKQMLLGFAKQIKLPDSPLDEIIDKLGGPGKVAEMTGRRGRMVRRSPSEQPQYELRDSDASEGVESLNVRERNAFMAGSKLVAIISDAASTGISLHADLRSANQRRRVHMTIELPWSADKAVQQLGRSHRSNQSSGPIYKLVTTDLGGERRFAAAVARRLQSLGALTKGDRRAATGANLSEFNFDTAYGRAALRIMYNAICQQEMARGVNLNDVYHGKGDLADFIKEMQESLVLMGVLDTENVLTTRVKEKETGDVSKFLNRILGLSVARQNMIFTYFTLCLDAQIEAAKREGRYNEGLVDIMAASVDMVGEPKEIFRGATKKNHPTQHIVLSIDRGMSWEKALIRLKNHSGKDDGFYCSRRETRGRRLYILATQKEGSPHMFQIARPNTGVSSFEEERNDLCSKYMPITTEKAESGWHEQYNKAEKQCIHGPHCRNGSTTCTVGSRCYKLHLLCGGIVTLMSLLESTIARYAAGLELSKAERHLRVVRAQLSNGERVVGIRYPEVLIPLVEKGIQEQRMVEKFLKKQSVLGNGMTVTIPDDAEVPENSKNLTAVTEEVKPVIGRCLSKALTPPVTIKNFFKPKKKNVDEAVGGSSAEGSPVPSVNSVTVEGLECTNDDDADIECIDVDETFETEKPKPTGRNSKSKHSKKRSKDLKPAVKTKDAWSEKSQGSTVNASTSKKRMSPAVSIDTRPAKKAKQADIMASFAKQKSINEERQSRPVTCPVCGQAFPPNTKNKDVNEHIDNCLIE